MSKYKAGASVKMFPPLSYLVGSGLIKRFRHLVTGENAAGHATTKFLVVFVQIRAVHGAKSGLAL